MHGKEKLYANLILKLEEEDWFYIWSINARDVIGPQKSGSGRARAFNLRAGRARALPENARRA